MDKEQFTSSKRSTKNILLVLGIIFVSFNLRPAITSVGPLIDAIRTDLGISNGVAGLITTLPLISFAILSPLASRIGRAWGNEVAIFIGMIVLLLGILIRSAGVIVTLFIGTALAGVGIAILNVLIPGIVKQKFPEKIGLLTSLYSTAMCIFAALASGVSIPLAQGLHLGWQKGLLFWAGLVILAAIIWLPQITRHARPTHSPGMKHSEKQVWRSPVAWQVTFFMGLQSFIFYCTVAWLPEILRSHGLSVATAGWMLSIMQFAGLPGNFITPVIADRFRDQRGIVAVISLLYLVGIVGLLAGGNILLLTIWIILLGLGQGASISLALALLGLRAANAQQASELSGMAQSVGYLLAAAGPFLLGLLYDQTHSWNIPLIVLLIALAAMVMAGLGAGRNRYVHHTSELPPLK